MTLKLSRRRFLEVTTAAAAASLTLGLDLQGVLAAGNVNIIVNWFQSFNRRKGPKIAYKNPNPIKTRRKNNTRPRSAAHQEQIDAILDKIKQSGYKSLTDEEKELLFRASKD